MLNDNPGAWALIGLLFELVHHAAAVAAFGLKDDVPFPLCGGRLAHQACQQRHCDGQLVFQGSLNGWCRIVAALVVVVSHAHSNAAQAVVRCTAAVLTEHPIPFVPLGVAGGLLRW